MASRLVRANAVTVNDVLDGLKLLEIDCVDRVYLTLSVPSLLVGGQVVSFLTAHERNPIPSPTLLEQRGLAFCRTVLSFAEANDIPVLGFADKRDKGRPGALAEHPEAVHPSPPGPAAAPGERPSRRGRLRITTLEVNGAGDYAINGAVTSLLAPAPVAIEHGSALIFVGHVSLDGAEGQLTCQMHSWLQRIESGQEVTLT